MTDESFKLDPKMDPMMMIALTLRQHGDVIGKLNKALQLLNEKVQCMENNLVENGYITIETEDEGSEEATPPTTIPEGSPDYLRTPEGGEDNPGSVVP